jgi:hypothetical protein
MPSFIVVLLSIFCCNFECFFSGVAMVEVRLK